MGSMLKGWWVSWGGGMTVTLSLSNGAWTRCQVSCDINLPLLPAEWNVTS